MFYGRLKGKKGEHLQPWSSRFILLMLLSLASCNALF